MARNLTKLVRREHCDTVQNVASLPQYGAQRRALQPTCLAAVLQAMASTLLEETRQAHDDIERLERWVEVPRLLFCTTCAMLAQTAPSCLRIMQVDCEGFHNKARCHAQGQANSEPPCAGHAGWHSGAVSKAGGSRRPRD